MKTETFLRCGDRMGNMEYTFDELPDRIACFKYEGDIKYKGYFDIRRLTQKDLVDFIDAMKKNGRCVIYLYADSHELQYWETENGKLNLIHMGKLHTSEFSLDNKYCIDCFQKLLPNIYLLMCNNVKLSLDYGHELKENPMYHIMDDLFIKLNMAPDLETFYKHNPVLEKLIKKFKHDMDHVSSDIDLEKKFQILGQKIEKLLDGRFIKEVLNPELSLKDNTVLWYKSNSKINPETDKYIVQAGYLTYFLIKSIE